jgi:hypothetical protein
MDACPRWDIHKEYLRKKKIANKLDRRNDYGKPIVLDGFKGVK